MLLFILKLLPTSLFFFFNDPATTEIYTLSLHDALPISLQMKFKRRLIFLGSARAIDEHPHRILYVDESRYVVDTALIKDRKSTRLNSSHPSISYAVFCLKKKKKKKHTIMISKKIT